MFTPRLLFLSVSAKCFCEHKSATVPFFPLRVSNFLPLPNVMVSKLKSQRMGLNALNHFTPKTASNSPNSNK